MIHFIGKIDEVFTDRSSNRKENGIRIFIKMVATDIDSLTEQSIYCRVQGKKALRVLEAMDEYGNVEGQWEATISPSVMDYEGSAHTIHANLLHCTDLKPVDKEPIVESEFPPLPLLLPAKSTGIANWFKSLKF